jgi:2OG-Fe(II) oxygenase superfamily
MKALPSSGEILSNLIIIDGFIDEPTCRALIEVHTSLMSLNGSSDNGLYVPGMRRKNSTAFQAAKSLIDRLRHMIDMRYGDKVGCDLALLCAIIPGFKHTLHADNSKIVCPTHGDNAERLVELGCQCEDIEVKPNHTSWRKYTALLYLDSNHEGGNIVFGEGPNIYGRSYRKEIEVKIGLLVLSPSNELYHHYTTPVTKGVRYSLNVWFTPDETRICRELA